MGVNLYPKVYYSIESSKQAIAMLLKRIIIKICLYIHTSQAAWSANLNHH